jgi:hypothetical protein
VIFLTLENPERYAVSLQKETQFSQGNNVLDPAASNIDEFLKEKQCFFHSLEWRYFTRR